MADYYKDRSEIEAIVKGFESCTTGKDDFTHRSHLAVAVYYLYHSTELEATERMRAGLLRFLDHHGVGRATFHETLTVFWIKSVLGFLGRLDPGLSLLEMTNATVERRGDSRLVFEFYSPELLQSDEAKHRWIEPDLKAMTETAD